VIGFLVGFLLQDIRVSLYVFTAGIVLAGLVRQKKAPPIAYLERLFSLLLWSISANSYLLSNVSISQLVIPAWPYLNRNSIQWLPSRAKAAAAAAAQQESSKAGKEKST